MLVYLDEVSKKNNEKVILDKASLTIDNQNKIALIGVNGCGKSTLLKLIANKTNIDSGKILRKNDLKLAYLSQDVVLKENESALSQLLSIDDKIEQFEAKAMLTRLGIDDVFVNVSTLSGGLRKRIALAMALLKPCDLLLLDEPTNHLDAMMIEWLETYLKKYNKAILMVTHDRYFMERVCDVMVEMDHGHLYRFDCNYSTYIEAKATRVQLAQSVYHKQKQLLKKELEWMRAGVQARGTKSKKRIERFYELQDQTQLHLDDHLQMDLLSSRLGKKVLEADDISMGYYQKRLFEHFSYHMQRSDRIGILGKNGCGKSTLLKVLAKHITPLHGEVVHGETMVLGYFKQGCEEIDGKMRVIDYIKEVSNEIETLSGKYSASMMLERFLFDAKSQYLPINRLSGGEKRRLYLLKVLMKAPNVLFLDEPTNDLDIVTLQILEDYLDEFSGAIIVVSHDRYFLDRICDKLFVFDNGKIKEMLGGYSSYVELSNNESKPVIKSSASYRQVEKMSTKEKNELASMDEVIELLSLQIDEIETKMNQESDYQIIMELSKQRDDKEVELEAKMLRWEELSEKKKRIEEQLKKTS